MVEHVSGVKLPRLADLGPLCMPAHICICIEHTVGPGVVTLRCFRDSFCALEDKRCKGENPHPVRASRYLGTLL